MRRCGEGQANQGKVLDDCCHVTSVSKTLRSKDHLLQLFFSLDASSAEHGIVEGKWKPSEKSPNLMKETEEENWETTENILAL